MIVVPDASVPLKWVLLRDDEPHTAAALSLREEAAYWLGMAMHRCRPRRVLMALRVLLTDPNNESRR